MTIAFRKIWRDLWDHKWRTLLVVLSISVGVMAVGMIVTARALMQKQIDATIQRTHPPQVVLSVNGNADQDALATIANLPDVAQADGVGSFPIRWKKNLTDEWERAVVRALDDYTQQKFSHITLRAGNYPTVDTIAFEAGYVARYNLPPVGSVIYIEVNDRPKAVRVGGLVQDPELSPMFTVEPNFYATPAMLVNLGGTQNYSRLRFSLTHFTQTRAEELARFAENKLSRLKVQASLVSIQPPQKFLWQDTIAALLLILAVMGLVSLVMSAFLVINTVQALISQQIYQIGLMKTIGAQTGQILIMYLLGVAVYSGLSLVLALPLGALGGVVMTNVVLEWFNIPPTSVEIIGEAFLYQTVAGLLIPLLAALFPAWNGTRISVREALAQYGLGTGRYGAGWLDRLLGRVRGLPRLITLPLRNTFRRVWRLALTQLALIAAGASFMMVASTHASFIYTMDQVLQTWGFDVQMSFGQAYRIEKVETLLRQYPDLELVEMWTAYSGKVSVPKNVDVTKIYSITLFGIPADSQMFSPRVTVGRGLDPQDRRGVLFNQKLARDLNVQVGDEIEIDYGALGKQKWRIVGLVADINAAQQTGYVPREQLGVDVGGVGRASVALARLKTKTIEAQEIFSNEARALFKSQHVSLTDAFTILKFRRDMGSTVAPLSGVLMFMSILIAIVGSLSLSSTLSINVIERRREIGVMRAVGASSADVAWVFVGEGLLLGLLSWVCALPLSLLGAPLFLEAIGVAFTFSLSYQYQPWGALIWLGVVCVLSLVASWFPAQQATRISVQQSLMYE